MAGNASTESPLSSVEVVTDSARLRELADGWVALWERCPAVGLFESFEYCLDAWELVEAPQGHQLACLAGWRGDELVAVWPFVTYRNRVWRHARQLVASGVELHELLVDETVDVGAWVQKAWAALTRHARPDVVDLSFFDASTSAPALGAVPALAVETGTVESVSVELRNEETWEDFYNSLSKSYRKDFAKSRRRLEALGAFEFAVCEAGDDRIPALIDWTLEQKRKWADRTGKKGAWLYSNHYRAFLERQLAAPGTSARNVLLVLTLDGELLATQIAALSKGTLEAVIAGFNSDYDRFSPGARLNETMIRWAWEQGADCNLGAGSEPYKTFWSRGRVVTMTTRRLAVSGEASVPSRPRGWLRGCGPGGARHGPPRWGRPRRTARASRTAVSGRTREPDGLPAGARVPGCLDVGLGLGRDRPEQPHRREPGGSGSHDHDPHTAHHVRCRPFFRPITCIPSIQGVRRRTAFSVGSADSPDAAASSMHNVIHLFLAILWLACAPRHRAARVANLVIGVVLGLVTVLGFFGGMGMLGMAGLADPDNFLHLITATLALYFGSLAAER